MITKEELQDLVAYAKQKLAIASAKYYNKLALGGRCKKTFDTLNTIRYYIRILENFKIIGETDPCNCTVVGDYTVKLVDASELTNSPIQFNNDGTGYLIYNNVGYPFTYSYGEVNKIITLSFPGTPPDITFREIQFTDECNITNTTQSPIEVTEITPILPPAPGFDGEMILKNGSGVVIGDLTIPSEVMTNYEDIANYWNENNPISPDWLVYWDGEKFVCTSPLNSTNYFGWGFTFIDFEGEDGEVTFTSPLTLPAQGNLFVQCIGAPDGDFVICDSTQQYNNLQDVVNVINAGNTQGIVAEVSGSNIVFKAPQYSYDTFNGVEIEMAFVYSNGNPSYNQLNPFSGGVEPTETTYEEFFAPNGDIGEFINDNPCTPKENTLECLTNEEIEIICDRLKTLI